jgi:hypothetical protein
LLKLLEDCRFQIIELRHIFEDLLTTRFSILVLALIAVMVKGEGEGEGKVYSITGDEGP